MRVAHQTPSAPPPSSRRWSGYTHLLTARLLELKREPEAIFWSFGFPILLALGLGIAFRNKPADVVHVAVALTNPRAPAAADALRRDKGIAVEAVSADSAAIGLRTGRIALVVFASDSGVVYQFDDTRPDART